MKAALAFAVSVALAGPGYAQLFLETTPMHLVGIGGTLALIAMGVVPSERIFSRRLAKTRHAAGLTLCESKTYFESASSPLRVASDSALARCARALAVALLAQPLGRRAVSSPRSSSRSRRLLCARAFVAPPLAPRRSRAARRHVRRRRRRLRRRGGAAATTDDVAAGRVPRRLARRQSS